MCVRMPVPSSLVSQVTCLVSSLLLSSYPFACYYLPEGDPLIRLASTDDDDDYKYGLGRNFLTRRVPLTFSNRSVTISAARAPATPLNAL